MEAAETVCRDVEKKYRIGIRHLLTALLVINFMYMYMCQLRTPFNYLLMNLSTTELLISTTGNPILAYNAFYK
jgi:hypothetical protein